MTVNIRIGRASKTLARAVANGYGCCYRCHTPWNLVDYHVTEFSDSRGCFPLCVKCFADLDPQQRLPFYRQLIKHWHRDDDGFDQEWDAVASAVRSEL